MLEITTILIKYKNKGFMCDVSSRMLKNRAKTFEFLGIACRRHGFDPQKSEFFLEDGSKIDYKSLSLE